MSVPNRHDSIALAGTAALTAAALLPGLHVLGHAGEDIGAGLYAALGGAAWVLPLWAADEAVGAWVGRPGAVRRRIRWALGALLAVVAFGLCGGGGHLGARLGGVIFGAIGFAAHLAVLLAVVWAVRHALGRERVGHAAARAAGLQQRVVNLWEQAGVALERKRIARVLEADVSVPMLSKPSGTRRPAPPPLPHRQQLAVVVEAEAEELEAAPLAPASPSAWRLPRIGLLAEPPVRNGANGREDLKRIASQIETRAYFHGVQVSCTPWKRGPVIDVFDAKPLPGTPLSALKKLGAELGLHFAGLRVVPAPGSGGLALEIPRPESERSTIALRSVLETPEWRRSSAVLPLALGLSSVGEPVIVDLATCPHLLVAGATGSGKSVGLNVMLTSLLLSRSPRDVRLALIDPKMVELAPYRELPHLLTPPATELGYAIPLLEWLCTEMDSRYTRFAGAGAVDIDSYNALAYEHVPRIVVVVDELADLMCADRKAVEGPLVRIAQKARAAGIHLIVATQRPSVDVATGLLKGNLSARIAFRVATRTDSQVVLDRPGAETLLGRGDSLCLFPPADLQRVHSAYVSGEDLRTIVGAWRAQGRPEYELELRPEIEIAPVLLDAARARGLADRELDGPTPQRAAPAVARDHVWEAALEFARNNGTVSTGKLRKELSISFERAAELMDRMEAAGMLEAGPNRTRRFVEPSGSVGQSVSCPPGRSGGVPGPSEAN